LTDDELFRELLQSDDTASQQLAIMAKNRWLYDPVFRLEIFDEEAKIDASDFERLFNNTSKLNWLFAVRKRKVFSVNLKGSEILGHGGKSPWLETFPRVAYARVLGFVWPGHKYDYSEVKKKIDALCSAKYKKYIVYNLFDDEDKRR